MAADIGPPPGNVASGASLEDSRQSARSQAFIAPAFVAAMEAGHQSGPEFDLEGCGRPGYCRLRRRPAGAVFRNAVRYREPNRRVRRSTPWHGCVCV